MKNKVDCRASSRQYTDDIFVQPKRLAPNLQDRDCIMFPAVDQPEEKTEKHDTAEHDDAVIHALRTWFHRRRPHGEEGADEGVRYRHHGDWNACASKPERSPW